MMNKYLSKSELPTSSAPFFSNSYTLYDSKKYNSLDFEGMSKQMKFSINNKL